MKNRKVGLLLKIGEHKPERLMLPVDGACFQSGHDNIPGHLSAENEPYIPEMFYKAAG
jgi:hypothetical protein